jgi:hypothetical protein
MSCKEIDGMSTDGAVSGVASKHPEYTEYVDRWTRVANVVASKAKQYILNVEDLKGLPDNGSEAYAYYSRRNVRYVEAARFVNFTRKTKNSWLGAIFRKEPIIKLPKSIDYLVQDATGANVKLARLAQNICGEILEKGRVGILVDFPASAQGLTEKEQEDMDAKARLYMYRAESIINWNEEIEDGVPVLKLVVLQECDQKLDDDGFTWCQRTQYRVLKLIENENGNDMYVQQLWDEDQKTILEEYFPTDYTGANMDFIPFVFIGSHNNNTCVDPSPLYDIAELNIGHLRNSADYEESVHICGQPTLVMKTSLSQEMFDQSNPGGVRIGARRGLNLGPDGDAYFLEISPNNIAAEAMKQKEDQANKIGAKFVTNGGTNETAEGVRARLTGETSELTLVSVNCQDGLLQACDYAEMFMGESGQSEISINTDFIELALDAQLISQMTVLMNNGVISKNDIRDMLRESGDLAPDRTNDKIDSDVGDTLDNVNPLTSSNGATDGGN